MHKYIIFILLITNFSLSQENARLADSIFKYKKINPDRALEFGIEYNNLTLNRKYDLETQQVFGALGEILSSMGLHAPALNFLKQSIKIYETLPVKDRKFPELEKPPGVLLVIGNIYFSNSNYDKADELFVQAIDLFEKMNDEQAKFFGINTSMSNRALIKQARNDYDGAEKIFREVYQRRKEYGKAIDVLYSMNSILTNLLLKNENANAKSFLLSAKNFYDKEVKSGNKNPLLKRNMGYGYMSFGAIMQYKKEFEKAIIYLEKAQDLLVDFPIDAAATGSRLAECYLALNQFEEAENIAIKNLEYINLNEQEKKYNYKVLEKIYKEKGFNSDLLRIKDSIISMLSGVSTLKTLKSLDNFSTEVKLANSARELNESKIKYNTYLYVLIICFIVLLFLLITIRFNYNFQKEKGNRLEAEKQLISSELDEKNRELVSKANFILQRNEYLKKIMSKLESTVSKNDNLQSVSYELNSVINSEKSYKDFDKMFVKVYPHFYKELNKKASLTSTDLRLASYIKMNHTNSEIAIITGVSSRTIESQRYRLSKKLNIEKDQSLNSFLMSI